MRTRGAPWTWATIAIALLLMVGCAAGVDEGSGAEAEGGEAAGETAGSGTQAVQTVVVPAGTTLTFELGETLNTGTTTAGTTFSATVGEDVVVDGQTVIPAGTSAMGRVESAEQSGRVQGRASISLVMTEVSPGGQATAIETHPFQGTAESTRTDDAVTIGAGAGIGAAIGAAIGGGEGAAIGAAIGGGSGTAVVLATRGDEIELTPGTQINFELSQPIELNQ